LSVLTLFCTASIVSILLQIIPILIFVLPGIVVITLFPGAASDEALHTLFSNNFLPESIQGGLIIAVAAVLMASFAGLFNSTSSLITFDFYRSFRPNASDRKLVLVGRLSTMVLLLCSIMLIPISQTIDFSLC
jgi:SSS family solute:Na+ symporter